MSGTVFAQAIPILVSPIVARLYSPENLGALALFTSMTAILCVFATGRFELAIPVVHRDSEAFSILVGGCCLTLLVSAFLFLVVGGFSSQIAHLFGSDRMSTWLVFVPLSVAATGLYQLLNYWSNRKRQYRDIAQSRVMQSGAMAGSQVSFGFGKLGTSGLIIGALLGQFLAMIRLGSIVYRQDGSRFRGGMYKRCLSVLRRHQRFPVFMIPGQLANTASLQVAVILLSICYGPIIAGYYALAERVIIAPSAIVGTAVGDVFRQHAADLYRETGNCRSVYLRTSLLLLVVASVALLALAFGARWLFPTVFGARWAASGEIASIMAVLMFFQILSSPLSQTVYLAKLEHIDMIWQFARLLLSGLAIVAGAWGWHDYRVSIALYVCVVSLMYVIHSVLQYKVACGRILAVK